MTKNALKIKDKVAEQKRRWVRLTKVCNNNCLFCLDKENQDGTILPLKKITEDLREGRRQGAKRAILSGGEPTLHPQIFQIIKEAKRIGYSHVQMISNGRMLSYDDFAKKLKEAGLDEITLSLHSHLKKQFEKIVGVKKSYEQAMKGLFNALKNDFIVSVDIVLNKINLKNLKETMNFFIKAGVSEFDLLHLVPFGSAWKNRKKLFSPPTVAKKYLAQTLDLSKNKNLFIWTNRLPAEYLEGYEEFIQNPAKLYDEIKGTKGEFDDFIKKGKIMNCFGERCRFCFIKDFCRDLMELRKNKELTAKAQPKCLSQNVGQKEKLFKFKKNMDIYKFLDFYITHRYFVKSARCGKCRYDKNCDGAQINKIRRNGFKILQPK